MSVPAKKAAEAVAKKVIPAASRAVSASEASSIAPSAKGTEETTMPWNSWLSSFVAKSVGSSNYEKLRSVFLFRPDDVHGLEQIPRPNTKVAITEDGSKTAMFRYPSPGSQEGGKQPSEDVGTMYEDPYKVAYYPRDTRRMHEDPAFPNPELEEIKLALLPEDDEAVKEAKAKFEEGPQSSPGNKGRFATGPSDFDPSGLRASMSTNNEAVAQSLAENMPDHLPMPDWWNKQEELAAWYKENNLPTPLGAIGYGTVPREGRIARW
mmetsp:Transcript_19716/g.24865  ORF Transcript_19716/g.24865 Transcript_19716/m.24865 type:complete len:265 (-) Transcript_19716:132-926(-)|eukprot:CAMPEP_0203641796 /NCGR_PEP_ID=MMETSP0088-20131115/7134_1 /ASSEMBLY_ACC=CAM_ASM_001087 /TAXON_ID=426623 /ORGANISM="Chaetoceros affinis, Strain CCMP159" /LENGTH=264 /DNA_ID=CAMNT_0050497391 /DNA_START=29 /DNA_END=820 /DNA_ORIENTATION=-